jgi:hypothetical protein
MTDPVGKTFKSQMRQTDLLAYAGRVQIEMGQLKGIEDIGPILTRKLLLQSGAKMRALPITLESFKSVHWIDLTKLGDVKWTSQQTACRCP